jgi:hypothetical protein
MRIVIHMILFCLLSSSYALAQTTWKGLRFGMSETEFKQAYSGNLREVPAGEKVFELNDDDVQLIPDVSFQAKFWFISGLYRIYLEMKEDPFAGNPNATAKSVASMNFLNEQLQLKYGSPIVERGECRITSTMLVINPNFAGMCNKSWRAEGQVIELYWSMLNGRLKSCHLEYSPLSNDF